MTDPKPSSASSRPGVWEPPSPEALQALLPQYQIVTMLGRGGMGAVYKGVQKTLDRPVAIKILSAALDESEQGFSERFKNEAKAMAKLNHPGIVGVFDFGQTTDGLLYIVMEFVEGTDVAKMLAKQRRLPVDHAMAITAHVCDALAYAHERGIIHRDIKPANIMVGYDGIVRVADFGLAKMTHSGESGLTQSGMAMGTLHYMAPEALMLGSSVDHRADIYAVGVMLYQMLAGKLPQGLFQMPSKLVADLDPRYDGIIGKAMREDREVRYQTILALRADLDHILTQPVIKVEAAAEKAPAALPTQARPQRTIPQRQSAPEPEFAPPPRRSFSNTLVWATVVLLACVAGWLVIQRAGTPSGGVHSSDKTVSSTTTATEPEFITSQSESTSKLSPVTPLPTTGVWINGLAAWWGGVKDNDSFSREIDGPTRVDIDYAFLHPLPGSAPVLKDQAVRARARLPDGKGSFRVLLRMSKMADGKKLDRAYMADLNSGSGQVRLGFYRDGMHTGIQNFTLPPGFDYTSSHTLELQIISGILKVSLDGSILGTPTHAEITEGHPAVSGSAGTLIESFEFVNLAETVAPTTGKPSNVVSGEPKSAQPNATASTPMGESSSQWTIAFSKETHHSKATVPPGRPVSDQFHWVESNETFGNLTWEFADARPGTAGLEIAQAVLRFKTPDLNLAPSKDPVTVTHAGKVIGSRTGATRNAWNDIHLDPKQIPTTGQPFELTLNCGNDAVIVFGQKSSSPAHLVVTHAITRSPLVKSSPALSNPELIALEQQYHAALEKQVTPAVSEYARTILASYRSALDRAARTPGVSSTDATALRAETQRLTTDPTVPDADPPGTPHSLITLRQTYRQAVAAFRSEKEAPLKTIYDKQVAELRSKHAGDPTWATKEHPYVNSLGMKFVPVPGTQVLMCIHETRKRDYAAYAASVPGADETWKRGNSEEIPVAFVNWNDAQAFCRWLSDKEGVKLRLPTDREWSFAIGIAHLEDAAKSPEALGRLLPDLYPWGSTWPPPNDAGNFWDGPINDSLKNAGSPATYNDGYGGGTRSPVMSFKPNSLGIYDLEGNVLEWCDDWFSPLQKGRVQRGGSTWRGRGKGELLSSKRSGPPPENRSNFGDHGFRCVVDLAASGATTSSAMVAAKQPLPTTATPVSTPPAPPPATPVPAPPAADPDTLYRWTNQSGRVIRGAFIGLDNAGVKLRVDGNMVSVPLADLSMESRQQAQRLAAGTPVSSSALPDTVPTTGWQPVITDLASWLFKNPNIKRSGLWLDLPFGTSAAIAGTPDAAVKVRIQKMEGDHPYLLLRAAESLSTKSGSIELGWSNLDDFTRVTLGPRLTVSGTHETSRPLALGTEHELVLMAAGSQVAAFLDGKKIIEAATSVTNASSHFLGIRGGNKGLRIKDLEWMPLAQAKASAATPAPAAPPVRRVGVDRFDSARFSSGLVMLESNLKSQIMPAADNSHTPLLLQDLYTASVELEIEQCQKTTARAADLSWFEAERERVRSKSYPNGSNDPALPDRLQKMRAAYWQAALEIDRRLDASKK